MRRNLTSVSKLRSLPGVARLASLLALAAAAGACSSGTSSTTSPATSGDGAVVDGAFVTCATETRGPEDPTGIPYTSTGMNFTVKLLASSPTKPVKGNNTWSVEVDDAGGMPLDALDLTVTPWMPDHGHGSEPVAVTPAGSGTYSLMPVYLYMSGLWQVKLMITATSQDGGIADQAIIPICIP
jgi:YtkA-like